MISTEAARHTIRFRSASACRTFLLPLTLLLISAGPATATDLVGVVLDANGNPADNVTVRLSSNLIMSLAPTVLSETKTDGRGQFRITVSDRWFETPALLRQELVLTVQTRDLGNGGIVVNRGLPLPRQRLTIRLERWTKRKISVQSADNKPLAGVGVRLTNLLLPIIYPPRFSQRDTRYTASIPSGPLQSIGTTDDSGTVELLLPPAESIAAISAEVEKNGFVNWAVHTSNTTVPKGWSEKLKVPKLRRIPVEVTFNDGTASDLKLFVFSNSNTGRAPATTLRHAVDLNPDGKSTAVTFNKAFLTLRNTSEKKTDLHVSPVIFPISSMLKTLSLSFGKGVTVTGRAVSTEGEPAANIRLVGTGPSTMLTFSTDDKGRFNFTAPAGTLTLSPAGRSGYRVAKIGQDAAVVIPKTTDPHDLGDVSFTQLKSVQGIVRDAAGKTVSGAIVTAFWDEPFVYAKQVKINREERAKTDDDGQFTFHGLDPAAEPMISAEYNGAVTREMQSFTLEKQVTPVSLTITQSNAIRLSGRVIDQSGNGISGLQVTLRHRLKPPTTEPQLPIGSDVENIPLVTDKNGNYATPRSLKPWGEYVAVIHVGTKRETASGWKPAKTGETLVLSEIDDSRTTEITGRILTADGMPLSRARVALLTNDGQEKTLSNDDGTFTIERPTGRMPLLIAEADGFLSNGVSIKSGQNSLEIRLPRANQLPRKSQNESKSDTSQPVRWTVKQKQELAVTLADGFKDVDSQTRVRIDSAFARYLPDHFLGKPDSLPPSNQMTGLMIRSALANGLAENRPQEGLRLLDELPDAPMKMYMLIQFERSAKLKEDERMQLLARIVQGTRGIRQADHRVAAMGLVGERLLDLGQRESGEALLRETLKDAKQLSPAAFSGYARGVFASKLAQIDADLAFKLIEPLTDPSEFNRHLQNIAHELAAIDPDRSITLLDKMRKPDENSRPLASVRDLAAIRVCYRMIRVAPDKAEQLGRSIKHMSLKPYSFSLMTESLLNQKVVSDADRKLALRLHDEAWRMLAEVRKSQDLSEVAYLYPSTIAAIHLRQTAKLAPQQLPYRVWQTIALRRPVEKSGSYKLAGQGCVCEMAMALSEVDRNRAREVSLWLPGPSSGLMQFTSYVQYARSAAELIVELSPDQCEAALKAVANPRSNQRLRLAFVKALVRSGESRARAIRHDMALWFPDDEDMGPNE